MEVQDRMTNEEAIKWLNLEIEIWEAECKSLHPTKDALKVAIKALEELKWYREQDLIQREEVPVMRLCMAINTNHFDDATKILNGIPKAEPCRHK